MSISVYVDSHNRARSVTVGLYGSDNRQPSSLLASGSLASPADGAWNTIPIASTAVTAQDTYWIVVLGHGRSLRVRARANGPCHGLLSRQTKLSALPSRWSSGASQKACPISAYVNGTLSTTIGPPPPPSNTALPQISGTTTQGDTLSTTNGTWTGSPTSFAYRWEDCNTSGTSCSTIAGATGTTYTLGSGDVGDTVTVVVTASNAGGSASATSAPTAGVVAAPQPSGAPVVGAPGEPSVTCSTNLSPGASVQDALAGASAGQVVCLTSGTWPAQTLTGVTHARMVTLAAAPGATVTIGGLSITGQTTNLTIEGMHWTGPLSDRAGISNVVFQYNTIENLPDTFAVYSYPQSVGGSGVAQNVTVAYNQIDHVGSCVELDGGGGMQQNWIIAHNVCGPDIGLGISSSGDPSHYVQIGGVSGVTIAHNAFEGPYDSQGITDGPHNNVIHIWGGQSDINIQSNLIWHTDSRAQTILIQEGHTDNVSITNNLDVEDPADLTDSNIFTMAWDVNHAHGETVDDNTAVDPEWGTFDGILYESSYGDYPSTTGQTISGNIVASTPNSNSDGNFNVSCASSCSYSDNVSSDSTAPGTGSTTGWSPSWQNTSWTPTSGAPWVAPPSNYYKPTGLDSSLGYQGSVGP